jgi:two-component system LytT family response regulator
MNALRTLIVDDQPLARKRLRTLLAAEPDVDVVGECGDGEEALATIREARPDVVFLDLQMPGLDGFEVVGRIGTQPMPIVIFVTAYDEYALRAFEARALDYLLKPFSIERFQQALARARAQIDQQRAGVVARQLMDIVGGLPGTHVPAQRFTVRSGRRVFFVGPDDIDWIAAEGNYARLHTAAASYHLRETMSRLERTLEPHGFVRIHRSILVNLARVRELQLTAGGPEAVLANDTRLKVGARFKEQLFERMRRSR